MSSRVASLLLSTTFPGPRAAVCAAKTAAAAQHTGSAHWPARPNFPDLGLAIGLEDHLGDDVVVSVRDGDCCPRHVKFARQLSGAAPQNQLRFSARLMDYLDVEPTDAVAPTRAQRFEGGFLGGEARRVTFRFVLELLAVSDLFGRKHAASEALSVPIQHVLNADRLRDIDARTHDHEVLAPSLPNRRHYFNVCPVEDWFGGSGLPFGCRLRRRGLLVFRVLS